MKELKMHNGDVTDAPAVSKECLRSECIAPVYRVGGVWVCADGHEFRDASTFADSDHRLAGALPAHQPDTTDE